MRRLAVLMVVLALGTFAWAGDTKAEHLERLEKAGKVFAEIVNAPDGGIPVEVLDGARCVAVVPDMFKAGFIFGGRHGEGVATCRTSSGWSAPAFFTVTGGSWGAQIGAQSVDLVMMIMNEDGMQQLMKGKFEIGGSLSAAAGPVGRDASGKIGWDAAILAYSRAKGLFAGAVLEGAGIKQDEDATRDVYGNEDLSFQKILSGEVKAPAEAARFLQNVADAKNLTEGKNDDRPMRDADDKKDDKRIPDDKKKPE